MGNSFTPQQAIELARRAADDRVEAVRVLAEARAHLGDVHAEGERIRAEAEARVAALVADAAKADSRAYLAATRAGWSRDELRKIGFTEPLKTGRKRAKKVGSGEMVDQPDLEQASAVGDVDHHDGDDTPPA